MKHFKRLMAAVLTLFLLAGVLPLQPAQVQAASKTKTLRLEGTSAGGDAVKLKWKKVSGVSRYVVTSATCGTQKFKKVKTLKKSETSCVLKGLPASRGTKFIVTAQKKVNGKYKTIAKSLTAHVVTDENAVFTNPKKISLNKTKLTLKVGKTKTIKAKVVKLSKSKDLLGTNHDKKIRYYSSAPSIAKVSAKGKITAKKAGKAKIYAVSINGMQAVCTVKVKAVKKEVTPASHTLTYKYTGTVPDGAPAVPAAKTYKTGDKVTKAAVPTLEGYEFSGWKGEVSSMPDKDVKVTGSWSKKKIKITYHCPYPGRFPEHFNTYPYGARMYYYDIEEGVIAPENLWIPSEQMDELIRLLKGDINNIKEELENPDSGKEDGAEEYLAALQKILPKLEAQQKKIKDAESNELEYLTYTDTVEYGDSYKVKESEDIKEFASFRRYIGYFSGWTPEPDPERKSSYDGLYYYYPEVPIGAGDVLDNAIEDVDLYAANVHFLD